jgi:hypothetical protein
MNNTLKGLALAAGLTAASGSVNANLITIGSCNMESISNPNSEVCMGVDTDNNNLFFNIDVPTNNNFYNVNLFTLADLENPNFFMENSRINYELSSENDRFASLFPQYHAGVNSSQDNNLKLTLNITDELKNSIVAGDVGVDYKIALGHMFSNEVDWIAGKAFYNGEPTSVDEGLNTLGGIALGLGGIALMSNRRKKKQSLENFIA